MMDWIKSAVCEIACLSVDLICLGIVYKQYRNSVSTVDKIKGAPELELGKNLKQILEEGTLPYAVVRGTVKSTGQPIQSQYALNVVGVMQRVLVIEHKIQQDHFTGFWHPWVDVITDFTNEVPFQLTGGKNWNNVVVEVTEPQLAKELFLQTVYNKYTPSNKSLGSHLMEWMFGDHTKGLRVTEEMLVEGNILTGIGSLSLEGNRIILRPSKAGYYLTPLTKEALVHKLEVESNYYRTSTIIFMCVGVFVSVYAGRAFYRHWRKKLRDRAEHARREEVYRQRRQAARQHAAAPSCIVCMENPVEILLMDCGHVCVCADCAERLDNCPICRSEIARTVTAFLP